MITKFFIQMIFIIFQNISEKKILKFSSIILLKHFETELSLIPLPRIVTSQLMIWLILLVVTLLLPK